MLKARLRALQAAVVKISTESGTPCGTGFFVSPHLIVTCQHVVRDESLVQVCIEGNWQSCEIETSLQFQQYADVSLIRVQEPASQFVRLGRQFSLHDQLVIHSFPVRNARHHEEKITAEIEDDDHQHYEESMFSGVRLIKFKGGHVVSGMSGSPIFSVRTGRVIGVVSDSRSKATDLGGIGVPANAVMDSFEEIRKAQEATAWEGSPWSSDHQVAALYLEHYLDPDRPFYGRNSEFTQLDGWLADGLLPSVALLLAKGGSGKSALVSKWYWRVSHSQASRSGELAVVLLPISVRFQNAREQDVLPSLWAQLMQARFETLPVPSAMTIVDTRSKIRELLAEDMECGRQLLVIIDGLDETLGWEFDSTVLPRHLGYGVRVLLASRVLADVEADEWAARLQRTRKDDLYRIPLGLLSKEEVQTAAKDWWHTSDKLAHELGEALWLQTKGDPLVLSLLLTSNHREQAPEGRSLRSQKPGLAGFFRRWWDDQERLWGQHRATRLGTIGRALFSILSLAYEPLSRGAIVNLVKIVCPAMTRDDFDEALESLNRFVIGNTDAYTLCHPRLAEVEYERLKENHETRSIELCLLEWATSEVLERHTPNPYAVRYFWRHLVRAEIDDPTQWKLVSLPQFRAACEQLDDWHDVFNENIKMASQAGIRWIRRGSLNPGFAQALVLLIRLQLQRTTARTLHSRLSATMAAHLLSRHLWTPARAIAHVLSRYPDDFPLINALGIIAPYLERAGIRLALDAIGRQSSHAFSEPESLGVWPVALRAWELLEDRSPVIAWARSISGLGSAAALTAIATQAEGDDARHLLAEAIKAFVESDSGGDQVAFGLGNLISQYFPFDMVCLAAGMDVRSDPVEVAARIGCRPLGAPYRTKGPTPPVYEARLLRVAFPWLDELEKNRRVARVTKAIEATRIREETTVEFILFSELEFRIVDAGALADVCDRKQCKVLFDLICDIVESPSGVKRNEHRQLFRAALRFAFRLSPEERYRKAWHGLLRDVTFRGWPLELTDFFEAAARLPELLPDLSEMVGVFRTRGWDRHPDAITVLTSIAPYLTNEQLDAQRRSIEDFDPDLRDKAWQVISEAQVRGSQSDVNDVLKSDTKNGMTIEGRLFSFAVHGLSGTMSPEVFHAGYSAWRSFDDNMRTQTFSSLVSCINLPKLDDVAHWILPQSMSDRLALSYALPYLPVSELLKLPDRELLRIKNGIYDEQCLARALQTLAKTLGVSRAMKFALECGEVTGRVSEWVTRGLVAVAPLTDGDEYEALRPWILRIPDPDQYAKAGVVLVRDAARHGFATNLCGSVEHYLCELHERGAEHKAAQLLELLSGAELARALTLLDVDTAIARRNPESEGSWISRVCGLVPWASLTAIDKVFFAGEFKLISNSNVLRAAIASRLLNTRRSDLSITLARFVTGPDAWRCHARMLEMMDDLDLAQTFVRVVMLNGKAHIGVAAMARVLLNSVIGSNPELAAVVCAKILESAENQGEFILCLSLLCPVLWQFGIGDELKELLGALTC